MPLSFRITPFNSLDVFLSINDKDFNLKILPLICYEIIYSGKIFENSNFDLIINISEDGWFGNSIGPQQHFTHSGESESMDDNSGLLLFFLFVLPKTKVFMLAS